MDNIQSYGRRGLTIIELVGIASMQPLASWLILCI